MTGGSVSKSGLGAGNRPKRRMKAPTAPFAAPAEGCASPKMPSNQRNSADSELFRGSLGRENVPRKVLTEIAPPPAVHSVMDHVSPVLMFPDPSGHPDPSAH